MTTNTQPQTQGSGGDELEHILGHCMCHDDDMSCWYMRTWKSLDNGHKDYDEVSRLMDPLQKTVIEGYVQAREREARVDELEHYVTLHIDDKFSGHYKNGFMMAVQQFENHRDARLQQLKPQAGEGGEV